MPSEIEKFQQDLLESVKQMRRGEAVRTTRVELPEAAQARAKTGLSQQRLRSSWACPPERSRSGSRVVARPRVPPRRCSVLPLLTPKSCKNCVFESMHIG